MDQAPADHADAPDIGGRVLGILSAGLMLAGFAALAWAAVVALGQIIGWLRFAVWQPMPALLFGADGATRQAAAEYASRNPVELVPQLWAGGIAGTGLLGVDSILAWALGLHVAVPAIAAATLSFALAKWLAAQV